MHNPFFSKFPIRLPCTIFFDESTYFLCRPRKIGIIPHISPQSLYCCICIYIQNISVVQLNTLQNMHVPNSNYFQIKSNQLKSFYKKFMISVEQPEIKMWPFFSSLEDKNDSIQIHMYFVVYQICMVLLQPQMQLKLFYQKSHAHDSVNIFSIFSFNLRKTFDTKIKIYNLLYFSLVQIFSRTVILGNVFQNKIRNLLCQNQILYQKIKKF
eukprot:TRINITY_DN5420_c3_g1_i1.p1 TRINITY_DN5420_c3_g1~~TRINITY_DN5420_c3_g1_i1.p1  ORF type:complete len:211 (+),score=-7.14 TRINITY_DN5420_c3_g1_i1:149-781(+)